MKNLIYIIFILLSGCIIVVDDEYEHSYEYENDHTGRSGFYGYFHAPYIIDVGWECDGNTSHQDWTFWADTSDYDGLDNLHYIQVDIVPLYNYDYYQLHIDNHDYGYFERTIGLVSFRCDQAHDIYFTLYDKQGNYDEFYIFW